MLPPLRFISRSKLVQTHGSSYGFERLRARDMYLEIECARHRMSEDNHLTSKGRTDTSEVQIPKGPYESAVSGLFLVNMSAGDS
ncbi:hypothetical protein TIFTF001_006983 [Ficus carica]|uniref:Uncharacterized protein n=1 Tax=Ficus carica TaxID=3494 RepID=A0AA87ZID3_FICCA|nr:hypothetical protein TIFTF001_006983 [Ficus carica]